MPRKKPFDYMRAKDARLTDKIRHKLLGDLAWETFKDPMINEQESESLIAVLKEIGIKPSANQKDAIREFVKRRGARRFMRLVELYETAAGLRFAAVNAEGAAQIISRAVGQKIEPRSIRDLLPGGRRKREDRKLSFPLEWAYDKNLGFIELERSNDPLLRITIQDRTSFVIGYFP